MADRMHVLATALALLLLAVSTPASGAAWKLCDSSFTGGWLMDMLPSGVGFALKQKVRGATSVTHRTQDGGRTWTSMPSALSFSRTRALDTGNAVCWGYDTISESSPLRLWTAATGKLTNHTAEIPKGLANVQRVEFGDVAAVPGRNQAFAWGAVKIKNGTSFASIPCIWYWNGAGTTWKVTKAPGFVRKLVAASPTAAWATYSTTLDLPSTGTVLRWNGTAWAQIREGRANESVEVLKAVPATATTPANAWARHSKQANNRTTETLMLCGATMCIGKPQKTAGTTGTYPGWFLTGGFDAAGPNFALVWEALPSNNPNKTAVALQRYDGAKWTTVMQATQQRVTSGQFWETASPRFLLSVASPTRAVAIATHLLPATGKTNTVVTHTWNGAKWTQEANATFTKPPIFWAQALQALDSGSAVRALSDYFGANGGMWRLA